jgi:hypothetical protein
MFCASDEARSERGAAANGFYSSPRNVEVVGMEAHSLPSQYELADHGGRAETRKRQAVGFNGDFAAGCRCGELNAGTRGCFATGVRSTPLLMTTGDFASGLRTRSAPALVRGDFATGQRAEPSHAAIRDGQPVRRVLSRLRLRRLCEPWLRVMARGTVRVTHSDEARDDRGFVR